MSEISSRAVETQMLIRKPVDKVFEAFIDPSITSQFWFTRSSGKLETGKKYIWEWEMYQVSITILVKEIQQNKKIIIEWGDPATVVEFIFQSPGADRTYVVIREYGFQLEGEELLQKINDSTGGFTTVLDGLKAFLEHGIRLNLIGDKFAAG